MINLKNIYQILILYTVASFNPLKTYAAPVENLGKSLLQCGLTNNLSQSRCVLDEKVHENESETELSFNFELESNCIEVERDLEITLLGETRNIANGRKLYTFVSKESPLVIKAKNARVFHSRVYPAHCKVLLYKGNTHASSNQWRNWVEELEFLEKNLQASTLSLALNLDILQMSSALNLLSRLADSMAQELARDDLLELKNEIPAAIKLIEKLTESESSLISAPEILTLSKVQLILKRIEDDSFWRLENGEPRNINSLITNNEKEMLDSALQKARSFDQQQLLEHLRTHHLESIQSIKNKIDLIKKTMKKWSRE